MLYCLAVTSKETYVNGSCYYNNGKGQFKQGIFEDADAYAYFEDSYNTTGWGKLHVISNGEKESVAQMYCAGFIDGYLTTERTMEALRNYHANNAFGDGKTPEGDFKWVQQYVDWHNNNTKFLEEQIEQNPTDKYWIGISLIQEQMKGAVDGLNAHLAELGQTSISMIDYQMMQAAGDNEDLESWWSDWQPNGGPTYIPEGHCTGLIRLLDDYSDVFFAQDTWSAMYELHRYLKDYNLNVKEFTTKRISLSTSTGHLASTDDFWVADSGLIVMETTLHNFNKENYDKYLTYSGVQTWMRAYLCTLLAKDGKSWVDTFEKYNTGTYNNEYIILDTNKFVKGEKPTTDLLWMVEQLPGKFNQSDITPLFVEMGYWPSINTPYYPDMFIYADYPGQQEREPRKKLMWNYYDQPRYKILARDAPKVHNFDDFKKLMRYNNQKDPLLNNLVEGYTDPEPGQGILSRYDLRGDKAPFGAPNCFGGLDVKAISLSQSWGFVFDAILSPQYEDNPAFTFSEPICAGVAHEGLKDDEYKFGWTKFYPTNQDPDQYNRCAVGHKNMTKCFELPYCGFCMYTQSCLPGVESSKPLDGFSCLDGWRHKTVTPDYALPLVLSVSIILFLFSGLVFFIHFYYQRKRAAYEEVK